MCLYSKGLISMRKFIKWIYEACLMLQHHWILFRVRRVPVARNAELLPEESEKIWKAIQKDIKKIDAKN